MGFKGESWDHMKFATLAIFFCPSCSQVTVPHGFLLFLTSIINSFYEQNLGGCLKFPGNPCPSFDDTLMLLIWGHAFNENNNKKCVILACIDDLYWSVSKSQQMKYTTMHAAVSCTEMSMQKALFYPDYNTFHYSYLGPYLRGNDPYHTSLLRFFLIIRTT